MHDYDVIVIGGGPAGCYAALAAATQGCRVAFFEEHSAIGWPRHDPGWLMESEFTAYLINALDKVVPWTRVEEYRVRDAGSGKLIESCRLGGYIVRRDLLEKEIAAAAIKAGASLFINTKVVKLLRKEGKVEGIETNSSVIPTATGKIFICADGIRSASSGFAVHEALCETVKARPGLSYVLAKADVSSGIVEHFLSDDPSLHYKCFFTHHDGLCIMGGIQTAEVFNTLKKRSDNAVSRKIKDALPIEVGGFTRAHSGKYGEYFKQIVKDNILFIGDASGGAGNIHGMIQGQIAGTVAASAMKEHDLSKERLSEYQHLVLNTLGKAPFSYFSAREDFGAFNTWFREFEQSTKGMSATELAHVR